MKKKCTRSLLVAAVIFLASSPVLCAQMTNEFCTSTALAVKKQFPHGFSLGVRGEFWTKDNVNNLDLSFLRVYANYKPVSWLSLGLTCENLNVFNDAAQKGDLSVSSYTKNYLRIFSEATGTLNTGSVVSLSLRERYIFSWFGGKSVPACTQDGQYTTWEAAASASHVLRSKFNVKFKIPDSRWSPFVGPEFCNSLNQGAAFKLSQLRVYAGTNFKLSSISSFRFYYWCQTKFSSNEIHHFIGIDYYINL